MVDKKEQTTMTNLEKVSKILADFISETKCKESHTVKTKEINVSDIVKSTKPNNILQNLCWQAADINDINTQNHNLIAPFNFYVNAIQNNFLVPLIFDRQRNIKKNRL